MITKCPYCGNDTLEKYKPHVGDSYFISAVDDKSHRIFAEQGIICDLYVCTACGNMQLRAKLN